MNAIERHTFFDLFRPYFKVETGHNVLSQETAAAVEFLLEAFERQIVITQLEQIAYCFATVAWETAWTFRPIEEYGRGKGHPYGEKDAETGQTYYGKGYVQLTWRKNYKLLGDILGFDLEHDTSLALQPIIAFQILVKGMHDGLFTGKKLSDYINGNKKDYINARRIINGTDRARDIAEIARNFEKFLRQSQTVPADSTHKPAPDLSVTSADELATTQKPAPAPADKESKPPPAPQTVTKETPSTFVKWVTAIKLAIGGVLASATAWCGSNEVAQTITQKGAEKAIENADRPFLVQLGIVVLYMILGIGAGVFLMWVAAKFYDNSAERANKLNQQKAAIASDTEKATVEFTK
jgi:putative chitinase